MLGYTIGVIGALCWFWWHAVAGLIIDFWRSSGLTSFTFLHSASFLFLACCLREKISPSGTDI
jgi:hypothetical protein